MPDTQAPFQATSTVLGLKPRTTASGSAKIRNWSEEIKKQALFSARTTRKAYLDYLQGKLAKVSSRETKPKLAKFELQAALAEMGYTPQGGFKGDLSKWHGAVIPPARPGSITDLSSSRRINLILDTNIKQAISMGQLSTSENPMFLMINPAWRLRRHGARKKPRKDWRDRWRHAGDAVKWKGALKTDFVALKDSPIWKALGDGRGGYKDTLGSDYPPFAFGSGMAWANVGRNEWKMLCGKEGVPDQLESIRDKAKALKAAQEAAKGAGVAVASTGADGSGDFEGRVDSAIGITYRTEAVPIFKPDEAFRTEIADKVRKARELAKSKVDEAAKAVDAVNAAKGGVDAIAAEWPEFASALSREYATISFCAGELAKITADVKTLEGDMVRAQAKGWQIPTPTDEESQNVADVKASNVKDDVDNLVNLVRGKDVRTLVKAAEDAVVDARKTLDDTLAAECAKLLDEAQKAVDAMKDDEFEKMKDEFTEIKKKAKKEGRI